ncbi:leucine rich repeat domain containing protein [Musa troglodytarum]|uniref:Leucine rich repeat domain containing protein n=1 Tax=Musa troglodytarum TaxID=320322 RepID=A0A9E7GMS9_9LILI|nr:leucine rich repeat domain containing protein [Musa troglodytarum]
MSFLYFDDTEFSGRTSDTKKNSGGSQQILKRFKITLAVTEVPSSRTLRKVCAGEDAPFLLFSIPIYTLLLVWLLCRMNIVLSMSSLVPEKMARINCFSALLAGKKKKSKESPKAIHSSNENGDGDLLVKPEKFICASAETKEVSFEDLSVKSQSKKKASTDVKSVEDDNKDGNSVPTNVAIEAAYEGGDEHDDILSMKRDLSDFDLQALAAEKGEIKTHDLNQEFCNYEVGNESEKLEGITPEAMVRSGHVSDPGMGRTTAFWGSPMLKRSCSNIETKRASRLLGSPVKSHSYDDLRNLPEDFLREAPKAIPGSPASVVTSFSADKVMLKKRSSSQVLPSRSRKLWWKLFLWSHRNLHRTWSLKPQRIASLNRASNQRDGYCSDTMEPSRGEDLKNKKAADESEIRCRNGMWPPNQWVAFSAESSSLDRVNAWVHSLDDNPFCPIDDTENEDDEAVDGSSTHPTFLEIKEPSSRNNTRAGRRAAEEVLQANNIIQSLNAFSSVAHIAGMGLKVIPAISAFTSLRSVNLSGNFIVHVSPGSLPKSLHMLDLSRNKIATIEGLRELTRLRVLNLSYNRISRIGHGLSNCTLIKELYLAGNKISGVEGLHRLLKLTVLDLSFNKITTAKALGQLVANYNSLMALNLLGNPIQSNIGDDQLRKAVCSLLPHLAYLNKQPIKPQRAREVATDSVAKAALGNGGWGSRRRATRRVGHGSSSSGKGMTGEGSSHKGAGIGIIHRQYRTRLLLLLLGDGDGPEQCPEAHQMPRAGGEPLRIEEVVVAPPKAYEVRIKIICTSLCHSDVTIWSIKDPAGFPKIFGHEAVGVVESVGEHVEEVSVGDTVLPFCLAHCGDCADCRSVRSNVCTGVPLGLLDGVMPRDGTSRFTDASGAPVQHFLNVSSFSEYTVVDVTHVVKVAAAMPPEKACLFSCGVSTGVGAAWKAAAVEPKSTVAVFGLGSVGLAVAEGARLQGAGRIIGVDLNPDKFEIGKKFGITEFVNPKDIGERSVSEGWGKTIILGLEMHLSPISINTVEILQGKSIIGSLLGGIKPKTDIPILMNRYLNKELHLDEFITHEVGFHDINKAFELLMAGKSLRCIIWMDR